MISLRNIFWYSATFQLASALLIAPLRAQDIPLPQDESGLPLIKEWIRKIQMTNVEHDQLLKSQGRVIFVNGWADGKPKLVDFDIKKFNEISMFKTIGVDELEFALSINAYKGSADKGEENSEKTKKKKRKAKKGEISGKSAFYEIATRALDIVMIVENESTKDGHVKMIDARRKKVIYKGKAPSSHEPHILYDWLSRILGYHGVVVDSSQEFVLVAASSGIMSEDINSLILKDSTEKTVIRPSDRKGLGLMKLERWLGKYGMFSLLINEGKVPIGSKVIIEVGSAKKTTPTQGGKADDNSNLDKSKSENAVESEEE